MRHQKLTGFVVVSLFAALIPLYGQRGDERPEEKQSRPQERQPQGRTAPKAAPEQHQQRAAPAETARTQQATRPTEPQKQQPQRTVAAQPQPARQEARPQQAQAKPAQVQQTRAQAGQNRPTAGVTPQPAQQRTEQQARSWQQQKGWAQGGASVGHATFQQDRSQNWASDHRSWAQRGGYGGYYIPQAQFAASFGRTHYFRLGGLPVMYQGYPRFSYGGFAFLMLDPWPSDWPGNWYSADDVYVDYDNGYYLYNRRFPQERLAITIQL